MIYCLDTNVIIAVMRNNSPVIDSLKSKKPEEICISEIVRAELYLGCLKSARPNQERAKVDHVLNPIDRIPFEEDAVEHYASIRCDLEKSGQVIGPNDLLIAATARAIGAVMVTANIKEFSRVPGLVVEDWSTN